MVAWLAGSIAVILAAAAVLVVYSAAHQRSSPIAQPAEPATRVGTPALLDSQWWVTPMDGWRVNDQAGKPVLEHTTDGGAHWSVDFVFGSARLPRARDLAFLDSAHGYLRNVTTTSGAGRTTAVEIWATTDGRHWVRRNVPPGTQGELGISFISAGDGWGIFQVADFDTSIWHTSDGAVSWTRVSSLGVDPTPSTAIEGVRFWDARRGYVLWTSFAASTPGSTSTKATPHLLATVNGGASWRETALPLPSGMQWPLEISNVDLPHFFNAADAAIDYVTPQGVLVWTTTNGGMSWKGPKRLPFGTTVAFAAVDLSHWWVANDLGVTRTIDGGRGWSKIVSPSGLPQFGYLDFVDTDHGFAEPAGGRGGLYITTDGGRTWREAGSAAS
ncbi:MAG TPA: hypothetical protein VF160_10845 [Candidatus Dormibacteraeota bacterium]